MRPSLLRLKFCATRYSRKLLISRRRSVEDPSTSSRSCMTVPSKASLRGLPLGTNSGYREGLDGEDDPEAVTLRHRAPAQHRTSVHLNGPVARNDADDATPGWRRRPGTVASLGCHALMRTVEGALVGIAAHDVGGCEPAQQISKQPLRSTSTTSKKPVQQSNVMVGDEQYPRPGTTSELARRK